MQKQLVWGCGGGGMSASALNDANRGGKSLYYKTYNRLRDRTSRWICQWLLEHEAPRRKGRTPRRAKPSPNNPRVKRTRSVYESNTERKWKEKTPEGSGMEWGCCHSNRRRGRGAVIRGVDYNHGTKLIRSNYCIEQLICPTRRVCRVLFDSCIIDVRSFRFDAGFDYKPGCFWVHFCWISAKRIRRDRELEKIIGEIKNVQI